MNPDISIMAGDFSTTSSWSHRTLSDTDRPQENPRDSRRAFLETPLGSRTSSGNLLDPTRSVLNPGVVPCCHHQLENSHGLIDQGEKQKAPPPRDSSVRHKSTGRRGISAGAATAAAITYVTKVDGQPLTNEFPETHPDLDDHDHPATHQHLLTAVAGKGSFEQIRHLKRRCSELPHQAQNMSALRKFRIFQKDDRPDLVPSTSVDQSCDSLFEEKQEERKASTKLDNFTEFEGPVISEEEEAEAKPEKIPSISNCAVYLASNRSRSTIAEYHHSEIIQEPKNNDTIGGKWSAKSDCDDDDDVEGEEQDHVEEGEEALPNHVSSSAELTDPDFDSDEIVNRASSPEVDRLLPEDANVKNAPVEDAAAPEDVLSSSITGPDLPRNGEGDHEFVPEDNEEIKAESAAIGTNTEEGARSEYMPGLQLLMAMASCASRSHAGIQAGHLNPSGHAASSLMTNHLEAEVPPYSVSLAPSIASGHYRSNCNRRGDTGHGDKPGNDTGLPQQSADDQMKIAGSSMSVGQQATYLNNFGFPNNNAISFIDPTQFAFLQHGLTTHLVQLPLYSPTVYTVIAPAAFGGSYNQANLLPLNNSASTSPSPIFSPYQHQAAVCPGGLAQAGQKADDVHEDCAQKILDEDIPSCCPKQTTEEQDDGNDTRSGSCSEELRDRIEPSSEEAFKNLMRFAIAQVEDLERLPSNHLHSSTGVPKKRTEEAQPDPVAKSISDDQSNRAQEEKLADNPSRPTIKSDDPVTKKRSVEFLKIDKPEGQVENDGDREPTVLEADYQPSSLDSRSKSDKTKLVRSVVTLLRKKGTCFLKQDESGRWCDIGDHLAREKVGHSLRDHVTQIGRQKRKRAELAAMPDPMCPRSGVDADMYGDHIMEEEEEGCEY